MLQKIKNFIAEKLQSESKIPFIIIAFFLVFIIVNIIYITIASKTWTGVAVEDSYKKGLKYNETIAFAEKQKKLDWKFKYYFNQIGPDPKKGVFDFELLDKNYKPIKDAGLSVTFRRPAKDGYDFAKTATFQNGYYRVDVKFPINGKWHADIYAKSGEDEFRTKKKFVIK